MRITIPVLIWASVAVAGFLTVQALGERRRSRVLARLIPRTPTGDREVPEPVLEILRELLPGADPVEIWPRLRSAGIVVASVGILTAPRPLLLPLCAASSVVAMVFALRRRRGGTRSTRSTADDAELLASGLRAGAGPRSAIETLVDGGDPRWAAVGEALDAGEPLHRTLDAWARSHDDPGAGLLADAWAVAGTTGASAAAALDRVGATLRERVNLEREITALTAQALLSARVLTVVPVGFAVLVATVDHRVAGFLLTTGAGNVCILVGLALDHIGARWMRHLVEAAR